MNNGKIKGALAALVFALLVLKYLVGLPGILLAPLTVVMNVGGVAAFLLALAAAVSYLRWPIDVDLIRLDRDRLQEYRRDSVILFLLGIAGVFAGFGLAGLALVLAGINLNCLAAKAKATAPEV